MEWRKARLVSVVCFLLVPGICAFAQEKPATGRSQGIESELRQAIEENIKSTQAEDVEGTMKTVHSKSPLYQATRRQLVQIFGKVHGLKYELVSFKYLASDGDFAFARMQQRTTQTPASPTFRNNESDVLIAFRKENGWWKFWNQAMLEVKILNP